MKSVNCSFRHKSTRSLKRATHSYQLAAPESQRECLPAAWLLRTQGPGSMWGTQGLQAAWQPGPKGGELSGLGPTLSSPHFPCL